MLEVRSYSLWTKVVAEAHKCPFRSFIGTGSGQISSVPGGD